MARHRLALVRSCHFCCKTFGVGTHSNCLNEAILMITHNMVCCRKKKKKQQHTHTHTHTKLKLNRLTISLDKRGIGEEVVPDKYFSCGIFDIKFRFVFLFQGHCKLYSRGPNIWKDLLPSSEIHRYKTGI